MNLFFLDDDPVVAARFQCNEHINKMATECAQILSAIHWRKDAYKGPNHVDDGIGPYKDCKAVRDVLLPFRWVLQNLGNYRWAIAHGFALCDEFQRRAQSADASHGARIALEWLRDHEPRTIKAGNRTPFTPATIKGYEQLFDVPGDPVASFRKYYSFMVFFFKLRDGSGYTRGTWPQGEQPEWIESIRQQTPSGQQTEIALAIGKRKPLKKKEA